MATYKALKLIVDLEISAITCPGVWLPNKGEVLIRIWVLDKTSRTTSILPVFPLVYHENFSFERVFQCQRLPELHSLLAHEAFRAELQQLRSGRMTSLADFECSLLTLLFPEVDRPGLQCSEEVSLCMQPLFHFPGVLPPKLEIITRTSIQEELRGTTKNSCINKTISSEIVDCGQPRNSRNIHKLVVQAHSLRTPSPPEPSKYQRKRPPFVVRHVDPDIFKFPPQSLESLSPRSNAGSVGVDDAGDCTCRCSRQNRKVPENFNCDCDHQSSRLQCTSRCRKRDDVDKLVDLTDFMSLENCTCHKKSRCTVCRLYKAYFGNTYPHHQHHHSFSALTEGKERSTRLCSCSRSPPRTAPKYKSSRKPMCKISPKPCACFDDNDTSDPFQPNNLSEWCREKRGLRSKWEASKVKNYDSHSSYREKSS